MEDLTISFLTCLVSGSRGSRKSSVFHTSCFFANCSSSSWDTKPRPQQILFKPFTYYCIYPGLLSPLIRSLIRCQKNFHRKMYKLHPKQMPEPPKLSHFVLADDWNLLLALPSGSSPGWSSILLPRVRHPDKKIWSLICNSQARFILLHQSYTVPMAQHDMQFPRKVSTCHSDINHNNNNGLFIHKAFLASWSINTEQM